MGDVASAFITIVHKGVVGQTYNIGCDDEYTNMEVAEKLVLACKPKCKNVKDYIIHVEDRAFNDVRYYINSNKLKKLGWSVQTSFEEGLAKTVEWYKTVSSDWWEVGTDSALAPHPAPRV